MFLQRVEVAAATRRSRPHRRSGWPSPRISTLLASGRPPPLPLFLPSLLRALPLSPFLPPPFRLPFCLPLEGGRRPSGGRRPPGGLRADRRKAGEGDHGRGRGPSSRAPDALGDLVLGLPRGLSPPTSTSAASRTPGPGASRRRGDTASGRSASPPPEAAAAARSGDVAAGWRAAAGVASRSPGASTDASARRARRPRSGGALQAESPRSPRGRGRRRPGPWFPRSRSSSLLAARAAGHRAGLRPSPPRPDLQPARSVPPPRGGRPRPPSDSWSLDASR